MNHQFTEILLPLAGKDTYTYQVPKNLENKIVPGIRVVVQFGKKKYYAGIVCKLHSQPPDYETKSILTVLDDYQVVTNLQLKLWKWISSYYCCYPGEVMNAALPSGFKLFSESFLVVNNDFDLKLSVEEEEIVNFIRSHEFTSIEKLTASFGKNSLKTITALISKKIILNREQIKEKYKPKYEDFLVLSKRFRNEDTLQKLLDNLAKAPRQLKLMMSFLELIEDSGFTSSIAIKKDTLLKKADCNHAILNALIQKNVFEKHEKKVDRIEIRGYDSCRLKYLSNTQQSAYNQIKEQFKTKNVVLFQGVTSSGKTEIYMQLIKDELKKKKQVLYLLPEIALTSQIVNRVRSVFGNQVGVYHSKFSDNERIEIYEKVLKNEYDIILGVRSSVFLPFSRLNLIIVDEEHENTYKQTEPNPRYHARDTSVILAGFFEAKVLLGSATPSIESFYNAKSGKYGFVSLTERYGSMEMPQIILSDTLLARKRKQMKSFFTGELFEAIGKTLINKEQVILFQNRRGYSPYIECPDCGWIPYCKNCDVSLTYHKYRNQLVCHYCGFTGRLPQYCFSCESTTLETKGTGTQRLEDELSILFPKAKIERLDLDSTRRKHSIDNLISRFEHQKIDVLVGTQMITKGLDFENVNVVGIINADSLLSFPDFRASERSFQLMLQVSGRSGRKHKRGTVFIQTSNPGHSLMKALVQLDYEGAFLQILRERKEFKYPPYYRLIKIIIKHKKDEKVKKSAAIVASELKFDLHDRVLGPLTPLISRVKSYYIQEIVLKLEKQLNIQEVKDRLLQISQYMKKQPSFSTVQIYIDVDPQ
ncbi:primosomal protein N' [Bacteroidota bacterium]